jgi:diketogulonate reductase-like aldo/keto reductase
METGQNRMTLFQDGRTLQVRDARIPILGCGTWELRGEVCARIVAEALRLGFRHIDTAQGYDNEDAVGEGLRASGVPRRDVFVTTKVRPQLLSDGALQRSVEDSLVRLGLDYVDLMLIHWPNPSVPLRESLAALIETKRRGLVRNIGVSNFTIARLNEAVAISSEEIVTNQIEYHPYLDQQKLIAAIRQHGLAITAYCPIALGQVTDDPVIAEIAAQHRRSNVQVALRWLMQQGDVVAIPRTSKVDRLRENIAVFDFQLTDKEMDKMRGLTRPNSRLINEPEWVPAWD